jgi:flagellar biosynthesis/type III secretory pathway protein FliH
MSNLASSTYENTANKSSETDEITKMEITINLKDLDLSQLTTSVMDLGNHMNGYLMQTFKDAYNKGLKSGYVLGHKEGFKEGKKKGFDVGKQEGIKKGKKEAKQEYLEMFKNIDEDESDSQYSYHEPVITNQLQQMQYRYGQF